MKLLVCSLAVASVCLAQAQSLRSQIDTYNKAISNAMMKKDFATMGKLLHASVTPDFKYIEDRPGKPLDADGMIKELQMGLGGFQKVTSASAHITSLKETGKTAAVVVVYKMGGIVPGKDKKAHTMLSSGVSTETYVKAGGGWKLKQMVWKDTAMLLDGKPMDPSKMGV